MRIEFDRFTKLAVGVNTSSAFNFMVIVPDNFNMAKTFESNEGLVEISFADNPGAFHIAEVLKEKFRRLLEQSSCKYIVADAFLDEADLDLEDSKHSANTGCGILQLLPFGQAKTKSINLEQATNTFTLLELNADEGIEIYISGKKIEGEKVILSTAIESCTIKFINTTDTPKTVRAYAVGY